MKTIVICSGGLDSVTLAYLTASQSSLDSLICFDYGQRHRREIDSARQCAVNLGVPFDLIDISNLGRHLSGSALTDDIDVPSGHYAQDNMKITIVPNRNTIMLSIAFGLAAARQVDAVAMAVHGGDHYIYPDCREPFIEQFQSMQNLALDGVAQIDLQTPFVKQDKAYIVSEGARLNVPFEQTWSCYQGVDLHCGRCGTCVERREAFDISGIEDPTEYKDRDYWQSAVAQYHNQV